MLKFEPILNFLATDLQQQPPVFVQKKIVFIKKNVVHLHNDF